ncbi:MAG: methionine adenosyltransferase [Methanomassiliicoccaceae archaeon]|jgi:S-adenosylmethionine synthetase|nr:methionine adenosyltransferase [Methanomassiliicoccaceae archaeon]
MTKNIYVEGISEIPVPLGKVELVERKGIGHPDSVADALAEEMSKALCKMYKKEVGTVLHHNTDETQIAAGQSSPRFGGGCIVDPVYIMLVGRATTHLNDRDLPCKPTALKAARDYLRRTFPHLDTDSEAILDARLSQGSDDLRGVYQTSKFLANDTSFGVGYAPYSLTDRVVLETEEFINGRLKNDLKESGQDVKVMASRVDKDLTLTVACAMVDKYVDDADHYVSAVQQLKDKVYDNALKIVDDDLKIKLEVNTGDNIEKKVFYLTCTGLSQEQGDDGSVGRGNRANGLITPYRPMSMEATSGKNPITHIGKIYNIMSRLIAEDVAKNVSSDVEIRVRLLSQIGKPVSHPLNANVQLVSKDQKQITKWKSDAEAVVEHWLDNVDKVSEMIINGKVRTF